MILNSTSGKSVGQLTRAASRREGPESRVGRGAESPESRVAENAEARRVASRSKKLRVASSTIFLHHRFKLALLNGTRSHMQRGRTVFDSEYRHKAFYHFCFVSESIENHFFFFFFVDRYSKLRQHIMFSSNFTVTNNTEAKNLKGDNRNILCIFVTFFQEIAAFPA